MKTRLPILTLTVAIVADLVEVAATPIIGYFLAIPLEIYLYSWAKKYLLVDVPDSNKDLHNKKLELRNKIKNSLIFRIVLEYIPVINILPISTIFVLLAYRDKVKMSSIDKIVNKV